MTRVLSGPKGQLVVAALAHGLVTAGCAGPANVEALEQWTEAAAIPEPLQELHAAVLHGRIYIAGGFDADDATSTAAYRYDTVGDRWAPIRDLPQARHHMPLAVAADSLYAVGGLGPSGFGPVSTLWLYDEANDRWLDRAPLPEPRGASAVGV